MSAKPEPGGTPHPVSGRGRPAAPAASAAGSAPRTTAQPTGRSSRSRGKDYGMRGNTAHRSEEFSPDDFE